MYLKIKSKYIKNKIKGLDWSKHTYIDCLVNLEQYIINYPKTFIGNIHFSALKSKHQTDFIKILKELSPKKYLLYLEETKKSAKEKLKQTRLSKNKENLLKSKWQKMGGKI